MQKQEASKKDISTSKTDFTSESSTLKIFFKQLDQTNKVIPIFNKIDFKTKLIKRDGEEHFKFIRRKPHLDDVSILNIYVSNASAPTSEKRKLLKFKLHIDHQTIIKGEFNSSLSPKIRTSREKLNKYWS